jgi:glycosyltransferase involved in cell wall biosynthesis
MLKKKVLYISYDGMTDPLGQSQVIPYLVELSKHNYEFHILSSEKTENFKKFQHQISDILEEAHIYWHPVKYTKSPPVLSTILDIHRLNKEAHRLHKSFRFSLSHSRSYIAAFASLKLKKDSNLPFLFDMRGFYADERIDGELWNISNPLYRLVYRFFKRKEKQFMTAADHIISLTENGKTEICQWKLDGVSSDDITVIPCCADLDHFDPRLQTEKNNSGILKELNISSKDFILSYLGSLGTWYLPEEMLDFFVELRKKKPEAKFLIITRDNADFFIQLAIKKGLPKDSILIRSASRDEVPALLSISKLSLFFIKPVFSKKASSPTKLAEILGMGIPVICNSNVGDIDQIIEANHVGKVIHDFKREEYHRVLNKLDEILALKPSDLRTVSEKLFSLQEGTKRYLGAYQDILNGK